MSLVACPECNSSISSQANSCPQCGLPLKLRYVNIVLKVVNAILGLYLWLLAFMLLVLGLAVFTELL